MNFKRMAMLAATAALLGAPAAAQTGDFGQPVIVVVGYGDAEAPADYAELHFDMVGEGRTDTDALRALRTVRDRVEGGLKALAGATAIDIDTKDLTVQEIRGKGCDDRRYPGSIPPSTGECAVESHLASLEAEVRVAPATQVGNAASLAAQLGASRVRVGEGEVRDYAALEAAAARKALAQARLVADAVAAAQGVRLGPVLRVQNHEARTKVGDMSNSGLYVTGSRIAGEKSPEVLFEMKPPPVRAAATYTVVYAIAK